MYCSSTKNLSAIFHVKLNIFM
uniref:Uncharacterized protein n=1 Tax=Anguilla anguilla TaxID=7936 RepID=A0A0E9SJB2_ANGAN